MQAGRAGEGDGPNWHLSLVGGTAFGANDRLHLTWALIMPNVSGTSTTPMGVINGASRRADPNDPLADPVTEFPFLRHTFTIDGQSTRRYAFGDGGCYARDANSPATGQCTYQTASGGPEFAVQKRAFDHGLFGSEVERNNMFVGLQREILAGPSAASATIPSSRKRSRT